MAKLLVVDDNIMDGRSVAAAGEAAGHEAARAYTLDQALRAAQGCDVVFLDTTLPDADQDQALERLAELEAAPLVILLLPENGEAPGWKGEVLRKPVSGQEVVEVLARVLDKGEQASPAKAAKRAGKKGKAKSGAKSGPEPVLAGPLPTLKEFRDIQEKSYLEQLAKEADHDVPKALEIAGISRAGYYNLLKKHGLTGKDSG